MEGQSASPSRAGGRAEELRVPGISEVVAGWREGPEVLLREAPVGGGWLNC